MTNHQPTDLPLQVGDEYERIRDLLREFTTYDGDGRDFTIEDHMFLDFEFWGRLVTIIDAPIHTELG